MMSWQHSFAFYCPTRRKWLISACAKIPLTVLGQTVTMEWLIQQRFTSTSVASTG